MQSGRRCYRSSRLHCAGRNFYEAECTNRAIVDELVRREVKPVFDFRGDLDVEWAGQPNWYFRISKFSIPFLKHPCVPIMGIDHNRDLQSVGASAGVIAG